MEKHYPERERTENRRRSRNKCVNYESTTKWCHQLKIDCVGPSNPLCKEYSEEKSLCNNHSKPTVAVGRLVYNKKLGVGMIMDIQKDIYLVRFHKDNTEFKYCLKQVKKMLLK